MKTKIDKPKSSNKSSSPFFNSKNDSGFFDIQPKLKVGEPGDKYEIEADRIAEIAVNSQSENQPFFAPAKSQVIQEKSLAESITPFVQRQEEEEEELQPKLIEPTVQKQEGEEEEEEEMQTKLVDTTVQRQEEELQMQPIEEEEEMLQPKTNSSGQDTQSATEQLLNSSKGNGSPLNPEIQVQMEGSFGADFGGVQIHTDNTAVQLNKELGAQAFTTGNNIYFNDGKYNPKTQNGKKLLAHELTHTIQQRGVVGKSIQRSPLSDELELIWNSGDKATFFDRLRRGNAFDIDLYLFVANGLYGDDFWLANNILIYGIESAWPIHLRVEREMKRWSDCGGKGSVFDILRTANGTESFNIQLIFSLARIFTQGSDDLWLATNLMLYGIEINWPVHLRIERAMKGWIDCGGAAEVHDILRAANGAEALNFDVYFALISHMTTALKYDRWLAFKLHEFGIEANFPMHVGIMNFFYEKGEEGPINTILNEGYTIKTFTGAFDTWRYHADGRIEEVDLTTRLRGNTARASKTIRLNATLTHQSASMTLYHELGHVTSTEPDYLEQEIQVRIQSEQFAIDHGLPPTGRNYRKADGTVNVAIIRQEIMGSTHYNPTDRSRIGRRYEGEAIIGPWALPI